MNILNSISDTASIPPDKINSFISLMQTISTANADQKNNDAMFSVTDKLISMSSEFINDVSTVNGIYGILNNLLPEPTNNTSAQPDVTQIAKAESLIEKMNSNLYKNIQPGQKMKIATPKYSVQMAKVSKNSINQFVVDSEEDNNDKKSVRILVSPNENSNCNPGAILCLNESNIKNIISSTKDGNVGLNSKYNKINILPIKQTNTIKTFSSDSLNLTILGGQSYRMLEAEHQNFYEVTLKIPSLKEGANVSLISSTACMQYKSDRSLSSSNCTTWYDYENMLVKCICPQQGLIVNMLDEFESKLRVASQFSPKLLNLCNIVN